MADLESMGVTGAADKIAAVNASRRPDDFPVWKRNWPILELFTACRQQWRVGPLSTMATAKIFYIGLDMTAVRAVADAFGLEWTRELVEDLAAMSDAATAEMNKG